MPRKTSKTGTFPSDAFTAGVEDDDDALSVGHPQTEPVPSIAVDLQGDSGAGSEPTHPETASSSDGGDGAATLGDVLGPDLLADVVSEPLLPGFAMSDDPLPPPTTQADIIKDYSAGGALQTTSPSGFPDAANHPGQLSYTEARNKMVRDHNARLDAADAAGAVASPPVQGDVLAPPTAGASPPKPLQSPRYESRIRILEAWQYPGGVAGAPDFVDRNWIGWASTDELRGMDPGPCLRVPISPDPDENTVVVARRGDFIVHEEITGDDGISRIRVEVWEKDHFLKLFMPAAAQNGSAEKLVKATARSIS